MSGGVSELKRATIYPRGRKASGGGRGGEASGCIRQFKRGQQQKKARENAADSNCQHGPCTFSNRHTHTDHTYVQRGRPEVPYGTTMDIWKCYPGDTIAFLCAFTLEKLTFYNRMLI